MVHLRYKFKDQLSKPHLSDGLIRGFTCYKHKNKSNTRHWFQTSYINSHILKQYCATPTYLAFCHTEWDWIFIYHRKRYRKSMFLCFEESKSKIFLNAHFPKYSRICLSQMSTHLIFNLQLTLTDIDHRSCNLNISSSFV